MALTSLAVASSPELRQLAMSPAAISTASGRVVGGGDGCGMALAVAGVVALAAEVGPDTGKVVAVTMVAAATLGTGVTVAGWPVAGEPVAGEPVAAEPMAGEPVAAAVLAGSAAPPAQALTKSTASHARCKPRRPALMEPQPAG